MNNIDFGPEWQILELICLNEQNDNIKYKITELFNNKKFRWGELIEHATVHKLLTLLSYNIISNEDFNQIKVPKLIYQLLETHFEANRYKTRLLRIEAIKITEILKSENILFACTKGIAYESTVYKANGSRNFENDIDIMIQPQDALTVEEILKKRGYKTGIYNRRTNSLDAYPRQEVMHFKLHPDHLLPFTIITDDPIFKAINIDIAFSFTWYSSQYAVPITDAFKKIKYINLPEETKSIPVLDEEFSFIFTVLHLFREAWFHERWIKFEQDVNLMKFSDVIRLYHQYEDVLTSSAFKNKILKYNLTEPICWVLEHVDKTFNKCMMKSLNMPPFKDDSFLNSAFSTKDDLCYWKGTMKERLFIRDKRKLFRSVQDI